MKERYQLLVGEKGNVIGHILSIRCKSVKSAVMRSKRVCSEWYHGDGWWVLYTDAGEYLDKGGKQ